MIGNPGYNPLQGKIEFVPYKGKKNVPTFVNQGGDSTLIDHIWASNRVINSYNKPNATRKEGTPGVQSYHYIIAITLNKRKKR